MASKLQLSKYAKAFDRFDIDKDGVLRQSDVTAMAKAWCDAYSVEPNTNEWNKINDLAVKLWKDMSATADTDASGEVSKDEWNVAMDDAGFVDSVALPFALAVFDMADSNNDGKLSKDEMSAAQSKAGISPAEIETMFKALDTDGDGFVERSEYSSAIRDFYRSDNPNSVGNLMAGSI